MLSVILGFIAIAVVNSSQVAAYDQQDFITPELQSVFNSYDTDGNHTIDWKEGMNFYNWVESAITYRYDDENDEQGIQALYEGLISDEQLGDGRSGADYWQEPAETYAERYGDCEDMAILELALYTYFNMTAYMGLVDVDGDGNIDHAICIVAFGEVAFEELVDQQGVVDYYELDGVKFVIVDNAYSDAYGFVGKFDPVTGDPIPNENIDFTLYEVMTLEQVFTLERQTGEEVPLSAIIEALIVVAFMVLPAFTYVFKKRST